MAKVKGVKGEDGTRIGYRFNCPGCDEEHIVNVYKPRESNGAIWKFNENIDSPTFMPSINISWGKEADPKAGEPEGLPPNNGWSGRCHSVITDGRIEYCLDCTHGLAGQIVDLPDI